jgi:hypothetical protein
MSLDKVGVLVITLLLFSSTEIASVNVPPVSIAIRKAIVKTPFISFALVECKLCSKIEETEIHY